MILDGKDFSKQIEELDAFINSINATEDKLIVVLHKAQDLVGYLPEKLQTHIAKKLHIPLAKVYGVVSFYSFFNVNPKGDYKVAVCMGTACFVRGANDVLEEFKKDLSINVGETTADNMFSLDGIRCVGACGLAPVVSVNGKVYGRVTKDDVKEIIEEYLAKGGANNE